MNDLKNVRKVTEHFVYLYFKNLHENSVKAFSAFCPLRPWIDSSTRFNPLPVICLLAIPNPAPLTPKFH